MDERATHSRTPTVDAHPAIKADGAKPALRAAIDGASTHDAADLRDVLRAIAARIDVVLDEKVAEGRAPSDRDQAAQAWSSVVGERATAESLDLRRQALATTVLRDAASEWPALDGQDGDAVDNGAHPADHDASEDAARRSGDSRDGSVRTSDAGLSGVQVMEGGRSPVEERLRAARERLVTRRATATARRADAPGWRPSRLRASMWRRSKMRTALQLLSIGLAIVGVSVVVGLLIA